MSNLIWMIEPEVFEGDFEPFQECLTSLGIKQVVCKFGTPYESYVPLFTKENRVVFYGSLQFARVIRQKAAWAPNLFCNLPQYDCANYYPLFGKHLLNSMYVMLPFGDLLRLKESLFSKLVVGNKMFIRPTSGGKQFTGQVVSHSDFNGICINSKMAYSDYVVIAKPKTIVREWRVVIVDGAVVGSTMYKEKGANVRSTGSPVAVTDYVTMLLKTVPYEPDVAWTMDVCELPSGDLKVLEVGSFSCCGLYDCEPLPIIEAINKVAV